MDERVAICSSVGEEVLQESELRNLLDKKKEGITAYDGFEPSGRMHIAQVFHHVNYAGDPSIRKLLVFW